MASVSVSLPEPMQRWIRARVEDGSYLDESDYLRDLIRQDQRCLLDDEHIAARVAEGLADADAGRVTPADEVFDRLEGKYRAMINAEAAEPR